MLDGIGVAAHMHTTVDALLDSRFGEGVSRIVATHILGSDPPVRDGLACGGITYDV